jgi:PilZ domain
MTDERRHYSRIAFHSPAQLIFTGTQRAVVVLDLSLKGALVRLPDSAPIELDTPCSLHVTLSEMDDQISMETRVAHVEGQNVGLICQNIDIDSVTHLRRLVELNLGNPELLERELSALITE